MSNRARRRSIEAQPAVGTWVRVRVYIAAAAIGGLLAGMAYKAYGVQVEDRAHYRELARRQHLRTVEVPAPRGVIYDANGAELAVTADIDSVFANPREVVDVAGSAERLAALLELDVREVEAKLSSNRYFVWIKRQISSEQADAVRAAGLPGIALTPEPRRYYPFQSLAGPLLGFANIDGHGLDGIELSMDELLVGKRARLAAVRDARGRIVLPAAAAADATEATAAGSIKLTLDRVVQFAAERALAAAIEEHKARAGTVVVLDVNDGSVMAMASWPTYDPNAPKGKAATADGARNRAVTDAYEIGSVMKIFTVAAALDTGAVRPDDVIDVEKGRFKIGRKVIRDTYHDTELTIGGVLKRSSNVGAVKIARKLGKDALYEALVRFGFGATTSIELPGERAGVLHPPDRWGEIGLATVSFGYGMTSTPLQVAAALAAVGNGGIYYEPRLIAEVVDGAGEILYRHRPQGRRVLRAETSAVLLPMLASVFDKGKDGGTARSVVIDGFRAGGKTGTSHKLDPKTRKYSKDLYLSSFIGLAPIDAPRIAVVVLIDEPHGEHHYGGKVAGPVFGQVVSETLRYLGVPGDPAAVEDDRERTAPPPALAAPAGDPPDDDDPVEPETVAAISDLEALGDPPAWIAENGQVIVPDFNGLGLARALDLARDRAIAVDVQGTGRVIEQFPPPGVADAGVTVRIVLSRGAR